LMRLLENVYETPSDVPLSHHANLPQIARVVHIQDLEMATHPTRQKLPRHRLI
jgi:cation transport regulator ChaB